MQSVDAWKSLRSICEVNYFSGKYHLIAHKFTLITRNKSFVQLRKNVIKHSVYGTNILYNNVQTCTQGRNWDASSPDLATYAGTFFSYAICLSNKFVIDQDDSYLDKHNHCVNEVDIKFCNSLLIANESNHSKIYLIPLLEYSCNARPLSGICDISPMHRALLLLNFPERHLDQRKRRKRICPHSFPIERASTANASGSGTGDTNTSNFLFRRVANMSKWGDPQA